MSTNIFDIIKQTRTIEDTLEYCMNKKLLLENQICSNCRFQCDLVSKPEEIDQYAYKCPICHTSVSVRNGSIFERSQVELWKILTIIYLWAYDMHSHETIVRECRISLPSIISEWIASIRTVCTEYFYRNPCQIGGHGHAIEIDECLYTRQQNGVDGIAQEPFWVFGGYDPGEKEGFLLALPDQDAHTLMLMIKKYILPGSTLMLDSQQALDRFGEEEYEELTGDHSIKFVDPDSKTITNLPGVRMWREAKNKNKKECGLENSLVDTYLTEFMWRQKFRDDAFNAMIYQIGCVYNFEHILIPGSLVHVKQERGNCEEP